MHIGLFTHRLINEHIQSFMPAHVQSNQFGRFECEGSTRTERIENKFQIDLVDTLAQTRLGYSQISQPKLTSL